MGWELTAEKQQEILHQRARELSTPKNDGLSLVENGMLIVKFLLAKELYGIETRFVQEVLPLKELTMIPGTPAFIMGVINVRGKIFPVLDPKIFFNLPERGITDFNKVILIDYELKHFGILTDAIRGTEVIRSGSLNPAPYTVSGIGNEFVQGITKDGLIILKTEALINSQHIIVNQ